MSAELDMLEGMEVQDGRGIGNRSIEIRAGDCSARIDLPSGCTPLAAYGAALRAIGLWLEEHDYDSPYHGGPSAAAHPTEAAARLTPAPTASPLPGKDNP